MRTSEGGIWKVIDTSLDRGVAIEILPDEFPSDPKRLARFEREAKMQASLSHRCIVTAKRTGNSILLASCGRGLAKWSGDRARRAVP